ncbi:putative ribosome quality control (RQC) complex YloA/Tae2 family protein [Natranaerovirga pectinivora]|uniref:Rqc2 homolog RqcH n=1 Tax=Natranaerovirga pectinivora TaxID=682400 RepID=A0A4R3MUH1_9FIRM|nr:NFACT RNA binding domain-containing protein [Natranaerovirga pectinivora]TCT16936.1 putative ribosome quality control (RQC) complex YloA/Tae2 family protein [Natranaerovirga pectinivora]
MALDGIVISNIVSELKETILDGRINKIQQPEKDEIILVIKNNKNTYKLLLSAQASLPLIYLTDESKTNPMTAPNFCMLLRKHINNGKIVDIIQPNFERIIEFHITHHNELGDLCTKRLIIEIMGRHSNIIFCDKDTVLDSIKHISQNVSSVREVLPGREYFYPPNQNKTNPLDIVSLENFKEILNKENMPVLKAIFTSLTGISPQVATELCFRACVDDTKASSSLTNDEITSLYSAFIEVFSIINSNTYKPIIYYNNEIPEDFSSIPLKSLGSFETTEFDSVSELLQNFYSTKSVVTRIKQKSSDIRKVIQNALERSYKKYDLQLKQLKDTEKRDKFKIYGEIILANAYGISEGQKELEAFNYYTNENIIIPLDETLTPPQNAKKYYDRYNKLKRTYDALQDQLEETKKEFTHLESINNALDIADKEDDLLYIRKELVDYGYIKKKHKDKKTNNIPSKPIHYISSDGFHIYVGKNNFQNDELSLKFANGDDWWFHTKDIPGSHVIVKSKGEDLPDKTFEEAAAAAAYYSKAKNSTKVAVDYTQKKHLKKPNGSKPGFVIYHTNYSMYVDPSIKGLTEVND